ncbi:hypothetical protein [Dictyobacter aurantiacus]|uniref:Uncharacterized protein n=1 Tax=Dictyobacter aurantiacus TaxID=1936993 RepID=A0A401ZIQ9_9CHLR|nr:hypothetical protein [Dictyobacter aurantiacus]GCE06718.1 hypothetical protein KDAU_40470 [Dictyobacter aurantiacus]
MRDRQTLTVYGTVNGEILGNGPLWYRISDQASAPQYIYSALVSTTKPVLVVTTGPITTPGKVIKVNLTAVTSVPAPTCRTPSTERR